MFNFHIIISPHSVTARTKCISKTSGSPTGICFFRSNAGEGKI